MNTNIIVVTSLGNVVVELNDELAPDTVANFLRYMDEGHYTNTLFHRVIEGFAIQGGGYDLKMQPKRALRTVKCEANNGLTHGAYTLAMARTSAPHSASSQFFINVKTNDFLNYPGHDGWGYAVFGKVIHGQEIVDAIQKVKTTRQHDHADVPEVPVIISEVRRVTVEDCEATMANGRSIDQMLPIADPFQDTIDKLNKVLVDLGDVNLSSDVLTENTRAYLVDALDGLQASINQLCVDQAAAKLQAA